MERPEPLRHIAVSPRDARQFVRRTLLGWNEDERVSDAELLVSEIVTGAVLRSGVNYAPVAITRRRGVIRVEVTDPGGALSADPPVVDLRTSKGVGLGIVDAVASRWGVEHVAEHRVLWFELD